MGATWEKYMGVTWKQAANVFLMIIIGSLLFGVGINGFILPHKLVSSGMSGVAIILYYLTGIQVGTWNLILNIPILYAAYRWLGRWQVVVTIFGTIIVSLAINVSSGLENLHWTQDPLVGLWAAYLAGLALVSYIVWVVIQVASIPLPLLSVSIMVCRLVLFCLLLML